MICCARDRENCTVFVAELPAGVQEDELTALFKDVSATFQAYFPIVLTRRCSAGASVRSR